MKETSSRKEKLYQFISILIPILITQLSLYAMNFFDTMMSGRSSREDLAGVAIGSSIWMPVFTGLSGILLAITPIVAQLIGAKQKKEAAFSVFQGMVLSIIMATIVIILGSFTLNPILESMSLEDKVHTVAHDYLVALSFGMVPVFMYTVLRSFIDALGMTRVTMIVTLISLPINIIFNYLLIFGELGFPKLGGIGAGYATAITYWLITFITFYIILRKDPFRGFQIFKQSVSISYKKWGEILKIGLPIGFAIFFETSIFAAVTLLMSDFNTITIASHQAALNFSSFLYMIPLSISMCLTIVVGHEVGAKRLKDAREYSWMGISFAVIMSFVSGLILFFFRYQVAELYSQDVDVIQLTGQFLLFALFFQLSDAIQAPVQGALRGYKDVNATFVMTLVSYWVIGLPLGYYLANNTNFGAFGYWIGLISGLTAGAICLTGRLLYVQKKKKLQPIVAD